MLAPHDKELLTAYVDGELDQHDLRRVARLLRRNPAARQLLALLKGDSGVLRGLPRIPAPPQLADSVMSLVQAAPRITSSTSDVVPQAPARLPDRWPLWRGLAAAAAVLLVVGFGSFLLHWFDRDADRPQQPLAYHPNDPDSAKDPTRIPDPQKPIERDPIVKDKPDTNPRQPELVVVGPDRPTTVAGMSVDEDPTPTERVVPDPEKPDNRIMTAGGAEKPGKFERVELALPEFFKLQNLEQPGESSRLSKLLAIAPGHRIELTGRDATKRFVKLQKVLLDRKITLTVDPATAARVKKAQWRTDLAIFIENISPAAVVTLLNELGVDRPGTDKKPTDIRVEGTVIVKELSAWDRRELSELLSIDPVKVRPAPSNRPAVDIRRPLSEQTAEQAAAAVLGAGSTRPGSPPSNPTAYATMLAGPRGRSADLVRFLDTRLPAQPGTIQLFLVLRNVAP